MLFSILIPVYNAEKYLEQSVSSATNQTYKGEYEIVILDDGSTDKGMAIAEEQQKKDPDRIRVYHQNNAGAYLTRRRLVELAHGEYMVFLDADDALVPDALDCLYNLIRNTKADIILFDLLKKDKDKDELFSLPFCDGECFKNEQKYEIYKVFMQTKYLSSMCTKAFKKECFDLDSNVSNLQGLKNGEDAYQSYPILDKANLIVYLKRVLYYYRKNDNSTTMTLNYRDRFLSMQMIMERTDDYLVKWEINEADRRIVLAKRLSNICSCVSTCIQSDDKSEIKREFIESVRNNSQFLYLVGIQQDLDINRYVRFMTKQLFAGRIWAIKLAIYTIKLVKHRF